MDVINDLAAMLISFSIYSFMGWVCETTYCSFHDSRFVNRGFLNGPFCPVYGFGALILIQTLSVVPRNPVLVFWVGCIATSALEYLTGYLLEMLFHTKWWDYSDRKFNLHGRICLLNSIVFGIMSVILVFAIYPFISRVVESIPTVARIYIAAALLVYFVVDIIMTVRSLNLLNKRLAALSSAFTTIKEKLDLSGFYEALNISRRLEKLHELHDTEKGRLLSASIENIKERIKHLESDNKLFQLRIIKAFPDIRSTRYPEMLTIIKEKIFNKSKKS